MNSEDLTRWWRSLDRPGWRNFAVAMLALATALFLALAGWVALTIVPALARRTPLRWLSYQIDYKVTREGLIYLGGIFVVALAALNTGNNLLFMVLACLLAGVLISGLLSRIVLTAVDLRLELPEHIFAGQPIIAIATLHNVKKFMPSFSVSLVSDGENKPGKGKANRLVRATHTPGLLPRPIYFPYIPRGQTVRQSIEITFAKRGVYRQNVLGLRTRFPFGFLQKTRRVNSEIEALVYPQVQPTEEFLDILPMVAGELESYQRGRGHDLYAIRDYQSNDSSRHVDWKASARTNVLQVREYAREDERRVLLAFDPHLSPNGDTAARATDQFERAVALCAGLAWHFYESNSVMEFRSAGFATQRATAGQIIYDALQQLARVAPVGPKAGPDFLDSLCDAPDIFKIVITCRPRGTIPTHLWASTYFVFVSS